MRSETLQSMDDVIERSTVDDHDCWLWHGPFDKDGYAVGAIAGQKIRMARWMWEQKHGRPMAPGKLACHTCDNNPCINPDHVYEGTYTTNNNDTSRRSGRRRLTDAQVQEIRAIEGPMTLALGRRYGMPTGTLIKVRRRECYADVPDKEPTP